MKRRREQEKDEAIAREQADARREALLAELKAHQTGSPEPEAAGSALLAADQAPEESQGDGRDREDDDEPG